MMRSGVTHSIVSTDSHSNVTILIMFQVHRDNHSPGTGTRWILIGNYLPVVGLVWHLPLLTQILKCLRTYEHREKAWETFWTQCVVFCLFNFFLIDKTSNQGTKWGHNCDINQLLPAYSPTHYSKHLWILFEPRKKMLAMISQSRKLCQDATRMST